MKESFSDLPEFYAAPLPIRTPPPPPVPVQSQALVPLRPRKPRGLSSLSEQSRQSSGLTSPSIASSRTSISAFDRHQDHVNIGIDFGTTYSGVSWTISGKHDTGIHTVENWPNGQHVKVPTEISYGSDGTIQWGYDVSPDVEKLKWFKLLLAEESLSQAVRDSPQLESTRKLLQKLKKGVVEVTADYLRCIWNYAMTEIKHQNPRSVDGMPFRIVIGVPANWPQAAQDKMRRAAAQAGLLDTRAGGLVTDLEFVAEPEAAAVASFYEGNIRHNINVGDIVIICDAGGGTVDIVTYEVSRVDPSITLSERIGNDMGLCGSIFLDERFVKYIETMIGKEKFSKLSRTIQAQLMDTWEHSIKRQYYHGKAEIATPIPHEVAKAINSPYKKVFRKGKGSKQLTGDTMRFLSDDIRDIFDPVLSDILKLALKQRNATMQGKKKKPKALLLVGGLGGNQFLHQRLQAEFSTGDIDVIQPRGSNVWASISRGAAIKSMGYDDVYDDQPYPVVTSYISKAHYGMAYKEPYDSEKHTLEDRRVYDDGRGMDMVWDQMRWYVHKGQDVSKGDPVEMTWEFEQPDNRSRRNYTIKLYQCAVPDAPPRLTDDVRECAIITFTASENNTMVREGAGGQNFRVVRFDVRMTLRGMGKVDFETYVNGKLAGKRDVRVDT
ncbi:hypothetical protein EK21DRAFT_92091 [Setomelanomma holmii]|uniref:Actin-like ATPase domain-containing protein n=1 Tax=Setomelanomma holmii TaxID=210430 RepID=A0A9P4H388_9PLEO|nr:hypothetical protein EK21DRAFT_92091 [Setomelanomma holmii]